MCFVVLILFRVCVSFAFCFFFFFFFQAEDGIRDHCVTGVQTCALPISGKTTLLRILATLLRPSRGTARVAGYDCLRETADVRAHVGLLAHGAWVYEDLTPFENLRFWATLGGLPRSREALGGALAAVELDRVADERVRTFSLGMKRRLALARFVLAPPSVLLLDEPFAGIDQRAGKWLDGHLGAFK